MNVPTALHSRAATGGTDEWLTGPEAFQPLDAVYRFRVDLAARTEEIARCPRFLSDALSMSWSDLPGPGFVNPPYSLAGDFIAKAHDEMRRGFTTAALVNVASDTAAWDEYVLSDDRVFVRFIPGRLWFIAGVDIYKTHPVTRERVLSLRAGERGPSPHASAVLLFPGHRHTPPPPGGDERFGIYRVDHYRPRRLGAQEASND